MSDSTVAPFRPMYMATMTDAIAGGDLATMKQVAAEAEQHLATYGDVPGLLQLLKVEIAKAEANS
ncbi:DUF1843 domain-containing protein [Azospirillum lipoferum]|uniref:DUF1843 domain-containing protein n=1 Tax=Azospirillum lipoferum (strain 4B) TaxID=862719 RepID=G7ZEI3_AZOL4|nr:DUF1843 domain-containing protein [Azospirillum lipoferum]CBS90163.1 conserved protein of unknown function [Azospirillum lipoferum 4B]